LSRHLGSKAFEEVGTSPAWCIIAAVAAPAAVIIKLGIRHDDPTIGIRVKMPKTEGFRTWTEDDIAAFEAAYSADGSGIQFEAWRSGIAMASLSVQPRRADQ
jgi:hypothetical protein